ncbi:hypothetical protein [Nocardia aurea]|uniref:hypothetical protein n=1 Tax=Nocardia aurea TaxID=2144174 RepID=UPI0013003AEB|nr:hypothetical protein [Nocardia aurea]
MLATSPCVVPHAPRTLTPSEFPLPPSSSDDGLLEIEIAEICHADYDAVRRALTVITPEWSSSQP